MLFSDIERTSTGPKGYGEPEFEYLDRSARIEAIRVRSVYAEWYERYPVMHRQDLRARFRSTESVQHTSASFELYLHEMLSRLGYSCSVHPEIPGPRDRHPDFLAEATDEDLLYLEAVLATDTSDAVRGAVARLNVVYDGLNQTHCPNFYLSLSVRQVPDSAPSVRRLRVQIESWLDQLDANAVSTDVLDRGHHALPSREFREGALVIQVTAIPRSPERRGISNIRPIGSFSQGARWVGTWVAMRDNLISKARMYGQLDRPFVIAVNASDPHVDERDISQALFGQERIVVSVDDPSVPPEYGREPNGLWLGPSGVRYTRVSAVVVVGDLLPWTVGERTPVLYHNPWAERPVRGRICELTQYIPSDGCMTLSDGLNVRELLELPENWPEE